MCKQCRLTIAQGLGDLSYAKRHFDVAVLLVMMAAAAGGTATAT
jgi:hypothetical protein